MKSLMPSFLTNHSKSAPWVINKMKNNRKSPNINTVSFIAVQRDNNPILFSNPRYFFLLKDIINPIIALDAKYNDVSSPNDNNAILSS